MSKPKTTKPLSTAAAASTNNNTANSHVSSSNDLKQFSLPLFRAYGGFGASQQTDTQNGTSNGEVTKVEKSARENEEPAQQKVMIEKNASKNVINTDSVNKHRREEAKGMFEEEEDDDDKENDSDSGGVSGYEGDDEKIGKKNGGGRKKKKEKQ